MSLGHVNRLLAVKCKWSTVGMHRSDFFSPDTDAWALCICQYPIPIRYLDIWLLMLCGVKLKTEQMSLESFAEMESDSAVLTLVGSSFHHWGAKTENSRDFTVRALFSPSNGGTSQQADVDEQVLLQGRVVWPVFGGRRVQFHWRPWRPAPSSWIGCGPQQEGGGGSHGRIWEDCKRRPLQHSGYAATV